MSLGADPETPTPRWSMSEKLSSRQAPAQTPRPDGATSAGGSRVGWRHAPLWLRWLLTLIVLAGLTTGLIVALGSNDINGYTQDQRANTEADREGRIVVAQDQAPHVAALGRARRPQRALERTIAADMSRRIRRGELSGPLERARCTPTSAGRAGRRTFRCSVRAGDVGYPFLGVVDLRTRRITWCKRDPPASPTLDIPVSRRCRP